MDKRSEAGLRRKQKLEAHGCTAQYCNQEPESRGTEKAGGECMAIETYELEPLL